MAGLIAFKGYDASIYLMGWTGGYVMLALLLALHLRKFGRFTVPNSSAIVLFDHRAPSGRRLPDHYLDHLRHRADEGRWRGLLPIPGSGFPPWTFAGMGIVFVYAVLGGMKGITYTQIAQYCVLISAYTVPAIFISLNITGNPLPQLGLFGNIAGTDTPLLARSTGFWSISASRSIRPRKAEPSTWCCSPCR